MAVAVLALLGATVMGASAAAADDRTGEPVATPAAAVTRPSVLPVSTGLTDVGPVVPVLLGLTALMLVGGAGVLWQRCRDQSRA